MTDNTKHLTFVTFGQVHIHSVNGKTFDKDCVAVIVSSSPHEGRGIAFNTFDSKFSFEYPEKHWNIDRLRYYPRGYIPVNISMDEFEELYTGKFKSHE